MRAGERLKAWRGDRPQEEIAQSLKVDQTTVSRIERGDVLPGLALAIAIEELTDGHVPAASWLKKTRAA